MIWQSTTLMTVFDLSIIAVMSWCFVFYFSTRRIVVGTAPRFVMAVSMTGILIVALFYFAHLAIMHLASSLYPSWDADGTMRYLYPNFSWLAILVGLASIIVGFQTIANATRSSVQKLETTADELGNELETLRLAHDNSQQFLHAINNIDAQIALYDSESRLVHFNRRYGDVAGPSANQILPGMRLVEILRIRLGSGKIPVEALGRQEAWILERAKRFGKSPPPWEFSRDGRTFETREATMPDGGVMVTVTDITDRKKIENALRESEAQMRLITDNIPVQIAYVDQNHRVQFSNRNYADWYGRPQDQMIGVKIEDLMGPTAFAQVAKLRDKALAGEESSDVAELTAGDGRHMHYRATRVPHFGDDGSVLGYFLIVVDLSEIVEREALLRHAQKMEAVGQLTGGVAHEFNNLLQVIGANLDLTRARISDDGVQVFVASALNSVRRGAELTKQLLAFSSNQDLNITQVNINDLVRRMQGMLERTLGERFMVKTRLDKDVWRVMADEGQVENALLNLSLNARDAMPDGGLITVVTSNRIIEDGPHVRGPNFAPGEFAMLEVADNGTGVPPEILERVFDPFFTTKGVGQGTGLGLSMVHGFADQSGGFVEIESEPDQGTVVRIYLPRAGTLDSGPAATPKQAEQGSHAALQTGDTILVVEDDPNIRMAVVQILADLGCNIVEAKDGNAALSALDGRSDISILFTDIVLPGGLNGPELAERARKTRPELKVLYSTGHSNTGGRGFSNDGNSWFLQKPYSAEQLMDTLNKVMSV